MGGAWVSQCFDGIHDGAHSTRRFRTRTPETGTLSSLRWSPKRRRLPSFERRHHYYINRGLEMGLDTTACEMWWDEKSRFTSSTDRQDSTGLDQWVRSEVWCWRETRCTARAPYETLAPSDVPTREACWCGAGSLASRWCWSGRGCRTLPPFSSQWARCSSSERG